jgi:hypothetical protein
MFRPIGWGGSSSPPLRWHSAPGRRANFGRRCPGAGGDNVRTTVAVDVSHCKSIHGALAVAEADDCEGIAVPIVQEYRSAGLSVSQDDIGVAVAIEVGYLNRVDNILRFP